MKPVIVTQCYYCEKFLLCKEGQRTRGCPYCGRRIDISKAKVMKKFKEREEARRELRSLRAHSR